MRHSVTLCLFCLLALGLLLGMPYLKYAPWSRNMRFSTPKIAMKNDAGVFALVDGIYERCILFNEDGSYRASLTTEVAKTPKSLSFISDISLDNERLYVLDNMTSVGTTRRTAVRILAFNLDGEFLETLFNHPLSGDDALELSSIVADDGVLYCTQLSDSKMTVSKLEGGELKQIAEWQPCSVPLRRGYYSPADGVMTGQSADGAFYVKENGVTRRLECFGSRQHITSAVRHRSGKMYVADGNMLGLFEIDRNGMVTKLEKMDGIRLTCHGDELILCDQKAGSCSVRNLATGATRTYEKATYMPRHVLFCCLVWLDAFLLGMAVLVFCFHSLLGFVKRWRKLQSAIGVQEDSSFSLMSLYGRPALFFLLAFVAAGFILSSAHYNDLLECDHVKTNSLIAYMSRISQLELGDSLRFINSSADFGNAHHVKIEKFFNALQTEGDGFNNIYALMRFREDGTVMLVQHNFDLDYFGKEITADCVLGKTMLPCLDRVRKGETVAFTDSIQMDGLLFYAVFSPVYDSSQQLTGCQMLSYNRDFLKHASLMRIFKNLVNLFLFFVIAIFVYGEGKLAFAFIKKHFRNCAQNQSSKTVFEGHRTLVFMDAVENNLWVPIMAGLILELAKENDITDNLALWCGLPIMLHSLCSPLPNLFVGRSIRQNPRRSYLVCIFLRNILGSLCWIAAIFCHSLPLLCLGQAAMGMGDGISRTAAAAIRGVNGKIENHFKHLVFVNTEYALGCSLACIAGAYVCQSFGYVSVYALLFILGIIQAMVVVLLIHGDINSKNETEVPRFSPGALFKLVATYSRYLLRPPVLLRLLTGSLPLGACSCFNDYVLPLFNAREGYSVLISGLTITVSSSIATVLVTGSLSKNPGYGTARSLQMALFGLAASLFLFALSPTLSFMIIILVLISVCVSVTNTYMDRFFIDDAKKFGLPYSNVAGCLTLAYDILYAIFPMVFGLLIQRGYAALGLGCGGLILFIVAVSVICSRTNKPAPAVCTA